MFKENISHYCEACEQESHTLPITKTHTCGLKTIKQIKEMEHSKDQIVLTVKDEDIKMEFREKFVSDGIKKSYPVLPIGQWLNTATASNVEQFLLEKVKEARDEGFECGGDYGRKLLKQAEDKGYAEGVRLTEKKYQEARDEDIFDLLLSCYPRDMENFSTMTENQAYRLLKKFWNKLLEK